MSRPSPPNPLPPHLRAPRHTLLAPVAALVGLLGIAGWLLSGPLLEIWRLPSNPPDTAQRPLEPTPTAAPGPDYDRLGESRLFGHYDPAASTATAVPDESAAEPAFPDTPPESLPEAQLGLNVTGIVYAPEAGERRAIVTAAGTEPRAYAVDDAVPGDAVIRFIEARRVVVEVNGELRALSLPEPGPVSGTAAPARASADATLPRAPLTPADARAMALRRRAAAAQP